MKGITMIDASFFEDYPLYRAFGCSLPRDMSFEYYKKQFPAINLACDSCDKNQTFTLLRFSADAGMRLGVADIATPLQVKGAQVPLAAPSITTAFYSCVACNGNPIAYAVRLSDDASSIVKVGQHPSWSINPSRAVAKALGTHLAVFKKGLACESQSYGIGAFAYYRRIVENVIERLLNDIGEMLGNDPSYADYMDRLKNVKDSKAAENRIAVVKDLLPAMLRPGGRNPLGNLHEALSQGLHAESDEECLAIAGVTRATLVFLIEQVEGAKQNAKDYAQNMEAIKKTLEKRGKTRTDPK
jgi:hypothetical protein